MTIRIVTDSTCDLPAEVIKENNISVIPLFINLGNYEYQDQVDLSRDEFYRRLPDARPHPTTATPGPEAFTSLYQQLYEEGATQIISIHISEKLSATINVARKAAEKFTHIQVAPFDSKQLSLGMGYQVFAAARAAAEGKSVSEILALLEEQITRTHVFAALDSLEYLRRSGRMNFAMASLGTLLHIKPLLKMYEGNPTSERVRTREAAENRLVQLFNQYAPYEKVSILYSLTADRARNLMEKVKDLLPMQEVWMRTLNPVLGAHLGPGVVGFACISKENAGGK